jgi:hypothetical protein
MLIKLYNFKSNIKEFLFNFVNNLYHQRKQKYMLKEHWKEHIDMKYNIININIFRMICLIITKHK